MPPPRSWPESLAASAAFRRGGAWRDRVQEERRAALLDAAEGLFAAKGLLQTGLQEVGAAIGLAPTRCGRSSATGRWCWRRCSNGTWTG
jgi:hypothetical protein